uniref:Uncharacterized protein n=1 Tax=Paramormyrops kingsleyae TaxID=1676925 RepID=A0A3B3QHK7_9TELE
PEPPSYDLETKYKDDIIVRQGGVIRLCIPIKGKPNPICKWTKDGCELPQKSMIATSEDNTELVLKEAIREDSGTYSLMLENKCGKKMVHIKVKIIGPPAPPEGPLRFDDIQAHSVKVSWKPPADDGGSEILGYIVERRKVPKAAWYTVDTRCQIIGRPLPEIKWYRHGKELLESRKYAMSSDGRTHSLKVLADAQEDEGIYTCKAVNEAGETETSGKLVLEAPPQINPGYPLKEKYYAGCGTSLRLHVVYIGRPEPKIMWFHNTKPLEPSNKVIIENTDHYTHLVIKDVHRKDAGKYKVWFRNLFGTVDTILDVDIQARDTHYTVINLFGKTSYQFRVIAENKFGQSEPSEPTSPVVTKEDKSRVLNYDEEVDDVTEVSTSKAPNSEMKNLYNKYMIAEELGRGNFGIVHRCIEISSEKTFMVKFVKVKGADQAIVKKEIATLNLSRHKNFLCLHESFESPEELVMIYDFNSGVDIFERIASPDFELTERVIVKYIKQVCEALAFLHSKSFGHFDIKPENIVYTTRKGTNIKIIEMGQARHLTPGDSVKIQFTTPEYCAPEIHQHDLVSTVTDMWSVGVLAYEYLPCIPATHLHLKALHVCWSDGAGGGKHLGMGRKGLRGGKYPPSGASSPADPHNHPRSLKSTQGGGSRPIQTGAQSSGTTGHHRAWGSQPDPTTEEKLSPPHHSINSQTT